MQAGREWVGTCRPVSIALTILGITAAVATFACKPRRDDGGSALKVASTNESAPAVDMNDLSYMFVKNASGQIYPFIPVSQSWRDILAQAKMEMKDGGNSQPIMTAQVYKNVVQATENQGNFTPQNKSSSFKGIKTPFSADAADRYKDFEYDRLVVTSFRIDPCAPSLVLDPSRSNYQGPSKYWQGDNGQAYTQQAKAALNAEITRLGLGFQLSGTSPESAPRPFQKAANGRLRIVSGQPQGRYAADRGRAS
jgi:hypothetical protein